MLDTESQESYAEWSSPVASLGWVGHFGVLVPLAVFGVIVTWPERKRLWILHALAIAYAASVVMFFVFARYRYPLVPFLLLFAAAGLASVPRFVQLARSGLAPGAGLIVLCGRRLRELAAAVGALDASRSPRTTLAPRCRSSSARRGDHAPRAGDRAQSDYAPAHNNLGRGAARGRPPRRGGRAYQTALELRPDFPGAGYNLAKNSLHRAEPARRGH